MFYWVKYVVEIELTTCARNSSSVQAGMAYQTYSYPDDMVISEGSQRRWGIFVLPTFAIPSDPK